MADIFRNRDEHRLRAGWRILIHLLLIIAIGLPVLALASLAGNPAALGALIIAGAITAATWVASIIADKRYFTDFGMVLNRAWWFDYMYGLLGCCSQRVDE